MITPNIKPLDDRVLLKPLPESDTTKGGIIIPDSAREKPQEAQVIALGTGKRDSNNNIVEFTVKVGDRVIISKHSGTEVCVEGETFTITRENNILGIIN